MLPSLRPHCKASCVPVGGEREDAGEGHAVQQLLLVRVDPAAKVLHLVVGIVFYEASPKMLLRHDGEYFGSITPVGCGGGCA